jgi:hypothetical protein
MPLFFGKPKVEKDREDDVAAQKDIAALLVARDQRNREIDEKIRLDMIADRNALAKLPYGRYTTTSHRDFPSEQANDVYDKMKQQPLTKEERQEEINAIKVRIGEYKVKLHECCAKKEVYALETSFIINYLGEKNPLYVIEALECLQEIAKANIDSIKEMHGNAAKIIKLEHLLRGHCEQDIKFEEEEKSADAMQKKWADSYDKAVEDILKKNKEREKYIEEVELPRLKKEYKDYKRCNGYCVQSDYDGDKRALKEIADAHELLRKELEGLRALNVE